MSDEWKNSLCWNTKVITHNVPYGCTVEMSPIGRDKIDEINIFRPTTNHNMVVCRAFNTEGKPIYETSAKCGPNDVFDFNIGAKLALDRLYEDYDFTPRSKNLFSGKILFINPDQENNESLYGCSDWEVKDGLITSLGYANSKDCNLRILKNMPCSKLTERVNDMYFPCAYDWSKRNKVMYLENDKT